MLLKSLKGNDAPTREIAAGVLGRFGLDLRDHMEELGEAMNDPNPVTRSRLYEALAAIPHPSEETLRLLALGILDPVEEVRANVHHLLTWREAVPPSTSAVFLRALRDRRVDVRARGAVLLHKSSRVDASVASGLRKALMDPEESVRIDALQTIGQLASRLRSFPLVNEVTVVDAFVPPVQALLRDRDRTVRLCAAIRSLPPRLHD